MRAPISGYRDEFIVSMFSGRPKEYWCDANIVRSPVEGLFIHVKLGGKIVFQDFVHIADVVRDPGLIRRLSDDLKRKMATGNWDVANEK